MSLRHNCDKGVPGFSKRSFDGIKLICFTEEGRYENDHLKIFFTEEAMMPAIAWFHKVLGHPGKHGLFAAMHQYYHPILRQLITSFCCNACQRHKVGECSVKPDSMSPWSMDAAVFKCAKAGGSLCFWSFSKFHALLGFKDQRQYKIPSRWISQIWSRWQGRVYSLLGGGIHLIHCCQPGETKDTLP